MSIQILVLDDEKIVGDRLKASLEKEGHSLETFIDPFTALDRIREKAFDVVVTDIRMDGMDGIQVLEEARKKSPQTKVIMITGFGRLEVARESIKKGAFYFIAKALKEKEISKSIEKK